MLSQEKHNNFHYEMGFRLKQIRHAKKVSQEILAEALGIAKQTIQKYESGEVKMPPEVIYQCSKFFNISVGYLYGENSRQKYNHISMMIASEVMSLPNESLIKAIYSLIKIINLTCRKRDAKK